VNVVIVADRFPPEIGGSERIGQALATGLAQRGHRVRVVTHAHPAVTEPGVTSRDGYEIHRFSLDRANTVHLYRCYRTGARRTAASLLADADILHLQGPLTGRAFLDTSPPARVYTYFEPWHLEYDSLVAALRYSGVEAFAIRLWRPLLRCWLCRQQRRLLGAVPNVIALSQHSRRELDLFHPEPPARITRVAGCIDLERFGPGRGRTAARAALGLAADNSLVFAVRRLIPRMGLTALIDAIALLRAQGRDAQLVIAGLRLRNPGGRDAGRGSARDRRPHRSRAHGLVDRGRGAGGSARQGARRNRAQAGRPTHRLCPSALKRGDGRRHDRPLPQDAPTVPGAQLRPGPLAATRDHRSALAVSGASVRASSAATTAAPSGDQWPSPAR